MKLRFGSYLFLPILVLAAVALLACSDDSADPTPAGLLPTAQPVQPARSLSQEELAAIDVFETEKQDIEEGWDQFYQEFDSWRGDLTSCHPSSAREVLRELAASFTALTEEARNLPRTPGTSELADAVIAAAEAEEAALRQLRDRWQGGNISLFEMVEQRRAESALALNSSADMSLALQLELLVGPTSDELDQMEGFSESFDAVADAWDDFHDSYAAFARRESKLEEEDVAAGYERLLEELKGVLTTIEEITPSEINEDMIERLQDAAEDELAVLEFLAEFPPEFEKSEEGPTGTPEPVAQSLSAPSQRPPPTPMPSPEAGSGASPETTQQPAQQAPSAPSQPGPTKPATAAGPTVVITGDQETSISPRAELVAAIDTTEGILDELEQSIDEFIEDDSAERLADLQSFDGGLARFVRNWNEFNDTFTEWRATDGGCDRVEVASELAGFSQQAGELAGTVRSLPQSGTLVPVYTLMVEAAEREAAAFRTLSSSWTPFSVDVFKAVDDERVNAGRLRRQAGIALEELRSRQ